MPLPTFPSPMHLYSVYPDRITLNIRLNLRPDMQMFALRDHRRDFRLSGNSNHLRGTIRSIAYGDEYRIAVTRPRRNQPYMVLLDIEPLRRLRDTSLDYRGEVCWAGSENWLHPDQPHSNEGFWWYVDAVFADACNSVLAHFQERYDLVNEGEVTLGDVTLARLEVCADFVADDPGRVIAALHDAFLRSFRHVEERRQANSLARVEDDMLMLAGYARKQERFKVYEKTNRRIRLEMQLESAAAIRRIIGPRGNISWAENTHPFPQLFQPFANYALGCFEQVISQVSVFAVGGASITEFLYHIAMATEGDYGRSRVLLNALIYHDRIVRIADAEAVNILIRRLVLVPTAQRVWAPASRYRLALEDLRHMEALGLNPFSCEDGPRTLPFPMVPHAATGTPAGGVL